ncbi:MAG: tetratricopeptide repeat protein [Cyanobacteria bacterium SBLK]|nr:tetratricopeptide repeat protein [Cyanobacteria bacterium SBLK]
MATLATNLWWFENGFYGGDILDRLKRYKEAIESYNKAIQIEPEYAWAWFQKSWSSDILGQYEKALESCKNAIELGYKDSSIFFNRAIALLGLNS